MTNNLNLLTTLQVPRLTNSNSTKNTSFADSMKLKEKDFRNDLNEASRSRTDNVQKKKDVRSSYKDLSKATPARKIHNSEKSQYKVEDEDIKPEQEEEAVKKDNVDEVQLTSLEDLLNMLNNLTTGLDNSEVDAEDNGDSESTEQINPFLNNLIQKMTEDPAKKADAVNLYRGVINELFAGLEKPEGQIDMETLQQNKGQSTDIQKLNLDPQTKEMLEKLIMEKLQEMKQGKKSEAAETIPVQAEDEQTKTEQILKAIKAMQQSNSGRKLEVKSDKVENKEEHSDKLESLVTKMAEGQQLKVKTIVVEKPSIDSIKLNLNKINENLIIKNEQLQNDKTNNEDGMKLNMKNEKLAQVPKFEVMSQIVKKAQVGINGGRSEMNMQLEPENLGKLTLKLVMEKGNMTAKFVAENPQVKELIETNFNQLRDMLEEKGIAVQSFSVSVGHDGRSFEDRDNYRAWKEFNKNSSNTNDNISVESYGEAVGYENEAINPYVYHDGKIDYKA